MLLRRIGLFEKNRVYTHKDRTRSKVKNKRQPFEWLKFRKRVPWKMTGLIINNTGLINTNVKTLVSIYLFQT